MQTDTFHETGIGKYMVYSSTLVLDSLNIFWYYKMINGALKVLKDKKKDQPPSSDRMKVKQG